VPGVERAPLAEAMSGDLSLGIRRGHAEQRGVIEGSPPSEAVMLRKSKEKAEASPIRETGKTSARDRASICPL